LLLPGVTVSTGPDDYLPFQQLRLQRFNGKSWEGFGGLLDDRYIVETSRSTNGRKHDY
jgi:branched-chain amino acid transport system substrate-binding protein